MRRTEQNRFEREKKNLYTYVYLLLWLVFLYSSSVGASGSMDTSRFSLNHLHFPPQRFYANGELHIFSDSDVIRFDTIKRDGDYFFEVRTDWISGDATKFWGVVFGAQNPDNYYLFQISKPGYKSRGSYHLQRIRKIKNKKEFKYLVAPAYDTIIQPVVNYLKVGLVNDSVFLFINNQQVVALRDKEARNGGLGIYSDAGVHVHFSDLKIEDHEFMTSIQPIRHPDTIYALPSDSFTKVNYNFSDSKPNWPDKPDSYFERGYYKIYSFREPGWDYPIYKIDNFSMYLNIRVHHWDSAGYVSIHFHSDPSGSRVIQIMRIAEEPVLNYYRFLNPDSPAVVHRLPLAIDSGDVLQLLLESQDTDVKLTINDAERVLIMDEQGVQEETTMGLIRLFFYKMELDVLSLKINGRAIDEYGLKATMPTCAVFRLAKPATGEKPYVPSVPARHPIQKFFDSFTRFLDDWMDEWEGWFFVLWGGITIVTVIRIERWRMKRRRIKNFEKEFLLFIRLTRGSLWLNDIQGYFYPLKRKKLLSLLFRFQKAWSLQITHVDEKNDYLIELPAMLNALSSEIKSNSNSN